jgi:NTE family protein
MIEFYSNVNPHLKKWYDDMVANWSFIHPSILKDYFMNGWYIPAGAEAARRYYSAKQFLRTTGPLNVTTGILPWSAFGKFFDFFEHSNYMPRPDNKHYAPFSLKRTLKQFADFPIKTKEGEPRFLLVAVDAQTGDAVTFDSYSKEAKYHNDTNTTYNQNGIEIEHALATGTFPDFFDYPKFKVNNVEMGIKNEEEHIFWDGGFRSNTLLREVIQAHRDYWHKTRKHTEEEEQDEDRLENDVPDLEVYIADLWPSELKEKPISFDRDLVENRKWGIIFGDRTDYDEQVANFVTDYIDLAKQLKSLAERKGASTDELDHILDKYATSKNTIGQTRRYCELMGGRFRLTKVIRIDHKDDGNDVADKIFDYSRKTIEKLMDDGYRDALIQMGIQTMKDEFVKLENKFVKLNSKGCKIDKKDKDKDMEKLEQLEQEFQQIQQSVKLKIVVIQEQL